MHTQYTPFEPEDQRDRADDRLPQGGGYEGEAAATAPPQSSNSTAEGRIPAQPDNTTTADGVTTENRLDTPVIAAVPSEPDTTLAARKPPAPSTADPTEGESVDIRIPTCEIDLDSIAVDQDFAKMAAVKTESAVPSIQKPGGQLWFSPHPDQMLWKSFLAIKDEDDFGSISILNPSLAGDLAGEYSSTLLVPCITRQGSVFFWPIKLPDEGGGIDPTNEAKLEHAVSKRGKWMRLVWNTKSRSHDVKTPKFNSGPPEWPVDVLDLLKKTVSKVYVADLGHPLVKRLLGEGQ